MSNLIAIETARNQLSNLPGDVMAAIEPILRWLPRDLQFADTLLYTSTAALSATKAEVDDDAGARAVMIVTQSQGTLGYVQVFDLDADSVTVGTTVPRINVPVSATSGEVCWVVFGGNGAPSTWATGLTWAASTLEGGSAAMTNLPKVFMLYTGS
jgi:hypothetical protein